MTEEITAQPGDAIQILEGNFSGEKGTIIAVYNNSSSIELDVKEANDKPRKTVIPHKHYKVIK
jgi:transcription antitermination factor NusG